MYEQLCEEDMRVRLTHYVPVLVPLLITCNHENTGYINFVLVHSERLPHFKLIIRVQFKSNFLDTFEIMANYLMKPLTPAAVFLDKFFTTYFKILHTLKKSCNVFFRLNFIFFKVR